MSVVAGMEVGVAPFAGFGGCDDRRLQLEFKSVPTATVATGGITCTNITGGLTFSPPLTTTGSSAESTAVRLTAIGCTTSGSNVSSVTDGKATTTISSPSNACNRVLTTEFR